MTKTKPNFFIEKTFWQENVFVIGVDEVGRGALAGPVCGGACIFAPQCILEKNTQNKIRIDDSKKLTSFMREKTYEWICKNTLVFGFGQVGADKIDENGIVDSVENAMEEAITQCLKKLGNAKKNAKTHILIDYFGKAKIANLSYITQSAYIRGDEKSISIAAASIIAKVKRDRILQKYSYQYPQYHWDKNKGYGTRQHIEKIRTEGLSVFHRKSFLSRVLK